MSSQEKTASPSIPPAIVVTTDDGMRVVGAGGGMMRALHFVFEAERPGTWSQVLKQTGVATAKALASSLDARFATAGNLSLASLPLEACLEFLIRHVAENGWGKLTIDTSGAAENGIVVAHLEQGLAAGGLTGGKATAEPLLAGMLQGYFEHVTGQSLRCEDVTCMQQGESHCTFALTTPDRFEPVALFIGSESASQIIARLKA